MLADSAGRVHAEGPYGETNGRRTNEGCYMGWTNGSTILCLCAAAFFLDTQGGGAMGRKERAGEVSIIVNADDVGAHPLFTDASLAALASGRISSASVIVPGHDAKRALALLKEHPEYEVGVHLCLNGDWSPLTARESAPSLYNDRGTMWDTEEEVVEHVRPEEARVEWEAQVRSALDSGVRITHLDGHMGCYLRSRELLGSALEVSRNSGIPLIVPSPPSYLGAAPEGIVTVASYTGIYSLNGRTETLENRTLAYRELLGRLAPGTHYIFTHHARNEPGCEEIRDLNLRIDDFAFWTSEASSAMLHGLSIRLVGCEVLPHPPSSDEKGSR